MPQKCTRCGKDRIFSKKWKETVKSPFGESVLIHELYVCPDKECQAEVEKALARTAQLAEERAEAAEKREAKRRAAASRRSASSSNN